MEMRALPQDLGVGSADEGDDTVGIQGLQHETTTLWNIDGSDEPSFLKTRRRTRFHRDRDRQNWQCNSGSDSALASNDIQRVALT